ncbi:MAG: type II toxin-antitoxin system HicB family antitoxin [Candidatus Omnitrophica bacterium]|nr:type II toxin-antitoxin system HicB family antitoxin [Candidatus Omnitrophota bacterium]
MNTNYYTYKITWSPEDNQYVGLCIEFPSVSWLSSSAEEALKGVRSVVSDVVRDMQKNEEDIPEPFETKKYSGKFIVRVTPECHKRLAIEAAEAHVSLNRLINSRLTA